MATETQTQTTTDTQAALPLGDAGGTPIVKTSPQTPTKDAGTQGGAVVAEKKTEGTETKTDAAQGKSTETVPAELELKVPEAFKSDEASISQFKAMAKELKLSGEQAQKLLDASLSNSEKKATDAKSRWEKQQKEWAEAAKADKEYGGADFEKNLAIAKKALAKFGDESTLKYLDESGLGNHPGLLRAFYRAGKSIAEDSVATRTAGSSAEPMTEEKRLRIQFPSMFPTNP